jgi:hypothetical protein
MRRRLLNKQLLTDLIKTEREKLHPHKIKDRIKDSFSEIYYPSFKSFLIIVLLILPFLILSHPFRYSLGTLEFLDFRTSSHYQNMIAILTGIGVIIFALIIMIAESMRDDETRDRARILLKESFVFPLAVSEILAFFIFIWGDVNFWSVVPVIGIALFTIWSLGRTITVLFSKYKLAQKRMSLLKSRLQRSISLAVDERIGDNIFLSKLNAKEILMEYYPFSIENRSDYYCFDTAERGIISDINLAKLKEFADIVDIEGRKEGFAFGDEEKPESIGLFKEELQTQPGKIRLERNRNRFVQKKFRDYITDANNALICIDIKLVKDEKVLSKLKDIFKQIFIITRNDNFAEEIRHEIAGVKDQFISAINNKQLSKIEELIKLYRGLAEGFLEYVKRFGGHYTFEAALKERHEIMAGWYEVRWLRSEIREIFIKAMESHDREIIGDVTFLPTAIARQAINQKDHYLFQEFMVFVEVLYLYASKEKDAELKKLMLDLSWRRLREMADYDIGSRLRAKELSEEEIKSLKDYAVYFIIIFQRLLKSAFDQKDIESFKKFVDVTEKLFDDFKPSKSPNNTKHLKWQIERLQLPDEKIAGLKDAMQRQTILEGVEKEIADRKKQMFFGLSSWILNQLVSVKDGALNKEFYDSTQQTLPADLKKFTEIFLMTHSFEIEDFWGWSWWEMKFEGEVQQIQFLEKLERFYAVKALTIIERKSDDEIRAISLPHNRDLAYLAEGSRDLMKILDDINANHSNWTDVLSASAISKVHLLKELLQKAKVAQEREETEKKRSTPISQHKVNEFKDDVISGFKKSVKIQSIFKYFKLYRDKVNEPYRGDPSRFGINTVDDKAVFFEDWHVHFGSWGESYGRDLASGEDALLFSEIVKNCKEIKENQLSEKLHENMILFAENIDLYEYFEESFKPRWQNVPQLDIPGFQGWYESRKIRIPVFEIYRRSGTNSILILNKAKFGELIQYSPLNEGEDATLLKDIFYMSVHAFSEVKELLERFISEPPEWLRAVGDKEAQQNHLKERVLINIFERFEFIRPDDFEGYKLVVKLNDYPSGS